MKNFSTALLAIGGLTLLAATPTHAQIIITEVDASGSAASNNGFNNGYNEDWFELTNEGSSAVGITGWEMNDNHNLFTSAVAMTGISSIAAGQTVVFLDADSNPFASTAALNAAFETSWFGSTATVPAGFTIGNYAGTSSPGLSQSGDGVNIYNASGLLQAGVKFGSSTAGTSFDNSVAKLTSTTGLGTSDPTISTLSVVGTNGAFLTTGGHETGSPGAVPEPASAPLAALCLAAFAACTWWHRKLGRA